MEGSGTLCFRGMDYPKRGPFFAVKFQRLLLKSCIPLEVGTDGYAILSLVAMTEDYRRYRTAPRFWNSHLQNHLGLTYKRMKAARDRCVRAGWLHYEEGGKSKPGVYWVTVPECYEVEESPLGEENCTPDHCPSGTSNGGQTDQQTEMKGRSNGQSFIPIPNPSPAPAFQAKVAAADGSRREAIRLRLKQAGVTKIDHSIDTALSHGRSFDEIEAVLDFSERNPGAWGPGALVIRLCNPASDILATNEGWMTPSPKARETHIEQQKAADAVEAKRFREANAVRKADWSQLEFEFGKQLDELSPAALLALLAELRIKSNPATIKEGRPTAMVRPTLLRAIAERSARN